MVKTVKPPCLLFSDTSLWVSSALPKEITLHLGVGIGICILAIKGLGQEKMGHIPRGISPTIMGSIGKLWNISCAYSGINNQLDMIIWIMMDHAHPSIIARCCPRLCEVGFSPR